jgi:hypothetical protein
MFPEDLAVDQEGVPIWDVSDADLSRAICDSIDDNEADDVTLVGFCSGAETALRYCLRDLRVKRVIAIAPTTWFQFSKPWDRRIAASRTRQRRPYKPLFARRAESGELVTYRMSPQLYKTHPPMLATDAPPHLVPRLPETYFIALSSDTVCPPVSVRRIYDSCRARTKGLIEIVGLGHDYQLHPWQIPIVDAAIEQCLVRGGAFNEIWSIPYQTAKRLVTEVTRGDPNNSSDHDAASRLWLLLASDFPSVSLHDRMWLMGDIQRWYQGLGMGTGRRPHRINIAVSRVGSGLFFARPVPRENPPARRKRARGL